MGIISGEQFNGWFSNMGQSGIILQNIITVIMPIIMCVIAGFLIYHLIRAVMAKASAENKEQKRAAWNRIFGLGAAVVLVVTGPTLLLYFMNTIGKTVQTNTTTKNNIFKIIQWDLKSFFEKNHFYNKDKIKLWLF